MDGSGSARTVKGGMMMVDRDKVINELVEHIESALSVDSDYVDCVRTDLLQYTVSLLKEQEPKEAKRGSVGGFACFVCGNCGVAITDGDKFCRMCGKKVKWE